MSLQLPRAERPGTGRSMIAVAMLATLQLMLPGCATHYVPVLVPTLDCKLADSLLAGCEAPGAINQDTTFGEAIKLAQNDRHKLARCSLQQQDLANAVRSCNAAIAAHNAEIERRNEEQRKQAK